MAMIRHDGEEWCHIQADLLPRWQIYWQICLYRYSATSATIALALAIGLPGAASALEKQSLAVGDRAAVDAHGPPPPTLWLTTDDPDEDDGTSLSMLPPRR